jgi:hypothetical protein
MFFWILWATFVILTIEWLVRIYFWHLPLNFNKSTRKLPEQCTQAMCRALLASGNLVAITCWAITESPLPALVIAVAWYVWLCSVAYSMWLIIMRFWRMYSYTESTVSGHRPIKMNRQRF